MNNNKKLYKVIVMSVVVFIIVIVFGIVLLGSGGFKPKWEINEKTAKRLVASNFYNPDNVGLQCGQVEIKLGDVVNPYDYSIDDNYNVNGNEYYHLVAPSKRYELLTQKYEGCYYVVALRTTNPGVYDNNGFEVFKTRDELASIMKLKNSRIIEFEDSNVVTKLQFSSDILCEIYMQFE